MELLLEFAPHFAVMAVLMAGSAFFSCSEAALFYLSLEQRERLAYGGPLERGAWRLLESPNRLLTTILFWNLVINIAYFALSSIITIGLQDRGQNSAATLVAVGSLLILIVVGEMLPKNFGVLWPLRLAALVSMPITAAARALDPVMPLIDSVKDASRRLLIPQFVSEPYLELSDLDRAIEISTSDPLLMEHERSVLTRVVSLTEMRVEELMRPRRQYRSFSPPVRLDDLRGECTPSGYVLVTEPDSEEIALAVSLDNACLAVGERLDLHAEPVAYVPWCASAADALGEMRAQQRRVAAVLNEHGETIGIVTREDFLEYILQAEDAAVDVHSQESLLQDKGDGVWEADGKATLRRLAKQLEVTFPQTNCVTVAGVVQEQLQRLARPHDEIVWGGLKWSVIKARDHGSLTVRVQPFSDEGYSESDEEGR